MRVAAVALAVAVTSVLQAGCGGDDADTSSTSARPTTPDSASTDTSGGPTGTPTTTAAEPENLRILVTNDDGYDAEGIDVLVEALRGFRTWRSPSSLQRRTGAARGARRPPAP